MHRQSARICRGDRDPCEAGSGTPYVDPARGGDGDGGFTDWRGYIPAETHDQDGAALLGGVRQRIFFRIQEIRRNIEGEPNTLGDDFPRREPLKHRSRVETSGGRIHHDLELLRGQAGFGAHAHGDERRAQIYAVNGKRITRDRNLHAPRRGRNGLESWLERIRFEVGSQMHHRSLAAQNLQGRDRNSRSRRYGVAWRDKSRETPCFSGVEPVLRRQAARVGGRDGHSCGTPSQCPHFHKTIDNPHAQYFGVARCGSERKSIPIGIVEIRPDSYVR